MRVRRKVLHAVTEELGLKPGADAQKIAHGYKRQRAKLHVTAESAPEEVDTDEVLIDLDAREDLDDEVKADIEVKPAVVIKPEKAKAKPKAKKTKAKTKAKKSIFKKKDHGE